MAKQDQTPDPFAIGKKFAELDPTRIMREFTKACGAHQNTGVDVNAILESQKKNMEALQAANRRALEGVQAIADLQQRLLQQTMAEASEGLKSLSSAGSPQNAIAKQTEFAQSALEKATTNMREFAEMLTQTNQDVVDTINKRISESLGEIKDLVAKQQ